ncbi:hypothetical protein [Microtetraspora malaysiensis]|uniref:hypothetical protein n=1 Tax=Microtetraspora malaysiensis TaxID=161358 RepID=UPI003D921ED8
MVVVGQVAVRQHEAVRSPAELADLGGVRVDYLGRVVRRYAEQRSGAMSDPTRSLDDGG